MLILSRATYVKKRDDVVHRYFDKFSNEIAAGDYDAIADVREGHLQEIQSIADAFRKTLGSLADAVAASDGRAS